MGGGNPAISSSGFVPVPLSNLEANEYAPS
jgi:hypothetical protein